MTDAAIVDRTWLGQSTHARTVEIDRERLIAFAAATGQGDPVFRDRNAARAAGHPDIPAPPTWVFSLTQWLPDPDLSIARIAPEPSRVLHAGQSFAYHAPIHAGDRMTLVTTVSDIVPKRGNAMDIVSFTTEARSDSGVLHVSATSQIAVPRPRSETTEAGTTHSSRPRSRPSAPGRPHGDHGEAMPEETFGPITRETLRGFARTSGDGNPIHLDRAAARRAGLDDVIAHGMLSMAYVGRYLTDAFGPQALQSLTTRFKALTPVDATVTLRAQVVATDDAERELDFAMSRQDGVVTLEGRARVRPAHG